MVSQLHPGHQCPAAAACPSCSSDPAIGIVPFSPVLCRKQPCRGTLLPGMTIPLFQIRGTSPTAVPAPLLLPAAILCLA